MCAARNSAPPSCRCRSTSGRSRAGAAGHPPAQRDCGASEARRGRKTDGRHSRPYKECLMSNPSDRRYASTHEWAKLEGDVVTVGVTAFAVEQLTEPTYLELPA